MNVERERENERMRERERKKKEKERAQRTFMVYSIDVPCDESD